MIDHVIANLPAHERAAVEAQVLAYVWDTGHWPQRLEIQVTADPGPGWHKFPDQEPAPLPTNMTATIGAAVWRWYRLSH